MFSIPPAVGRPDFGSSHATVVSLCVAQTCFRVHWESIWVEAALAKNVGKSAFNHSLNKSVVGKNRKVVTSGLFELARAKSVCQGVRCICVAGIAQQAILRGRAPEKEHCLLRGALCAVRKVDYVGPVSLMAKSTATSTVPVFNLRYIYLHMDESLGIPPSRQNVKHREPVIPLFLAPPLARWLCANHQGKEGLGQATLA